MVGVNEDYVKGSADKGDLTPLERRIIGRAVRIEIPFAGKYQLRMIADLLRGYAERIDLYTRRRDIPEWQMLSHLKNEARMTQARIKDIVAHSGKGRRLKPYRQGLDEQ